MILVDSDPAFAENSGLIENPLISKENWETNLSDPLMPLTIRKILETMKRGEHSSTLVKRSCIKDENPDFWNYII